MQITGATEDIKTLDIETLKVAFEQKREQHGWHCAELGRLAGLMAQASVDGNITEVAALSARRAALQATIHAETLDRLKAAIGFHTARIEQANRKLASVHALQEKNARLATQLAAEAERLTFESQDAFQDLHESKTAVVRAQAELKQFTASETKED